MTRLPDWEDRLHAYLAEANGKPFVWGEHDCALFGAGVVLAMTGVDPVPEFRGRYSTEMGSARALRRYGAGTLRATIDGKFESVAPGFARRGDLAMADGMVGVVVGADAVFVSDVDGVSEFVRYPRSGWSAAWSVG